MQNKVVRRGGLAQPGLRERFESLGETDRLDDWRGGSLRHRWRVGQPDVLRCEDESPPNVENRVGPALDEPGHPVQGPEGFWPRTLAMGRSRNNLPLSLAFFSAPFDPE